MPLQIKDDTPQSFPSPQYLTLAGWKRGVITLVDKSKLPKDALESADNLFLMEDGQPTIRPGIGYYGNTIIGEPHDFGTFSITQFDYFDYSGAVHLVIAVDKPTDNISLIYRSTDNGQTWNSCPGNFTFNAEWHMNQNGNYLYLTNGTDNILRYDGTTTLQTYTALTTPAAPTVVETGLAGTGYNYYYKASAVNQVGFSAASVASAVVQTSVPRESWDATTNFAVITVDAFQATQTRADIYISEDNVDFFYLGSTSVTGATFKDAGITTAIPVPSTLAPTSNTTQGPKVKELTNIGSRQFGVRDTNNRHRIWFTGSGTYSGSFSSAYDGGYLDWQKGGKYLPWHVEDYRDGKGTPFATIWCKSADGQGCILQMSLDTLTIGNISITVPSAYKLPGSRGTPAPGSVVNVLNDYMFYNSQAFYNLGSRAQFLNLLSTDEASANIRPTVKRINKLYESGIASVYFDAKVYFSVPLDSSTKNNCTIIYDTERKAWLPTAFLDRGFAKFLRYVDTTGIEHLLGIEATVHASPTTGTTNYISEISSTIQGDYGVAFNTSLTTGLYPTTKNRFEFQWTEEAEIEFSNPQGDIHIELLGIERARGFRTIVTKTLTSPTISTSTGWDSFLWDSHLWDDTGVITAFSDSSVKRYFNVQKELNGIQWRITSSTLDAKYVLRTLQSWGTETQGGKPRSWKL